MKQKIVLLAAVTFLGFSCSRPYPPPKSPVRLEIAENFIDVELAATPEQWQRGLSGRLSLGRGQGMLFDMRSSDNRRPGFWMKDMKFPLDFIWIDKGRVVDITADVLASSPDALTAGAADRQLKIYYPSRDVDMVLEVNAGWSTANKIKIGDEVKLWL